MMRKMQSSTRRSEAKSATDSPSASRTLGAERGKQVTVKHTITVECRATIQETWVFVADQVLDRGQLEDELFAGNMDYVAGEIMGDEDDRRIISVDTDQGREFERGG